MMLMMMIIWTIIGCGCVCEWWLFQRPFKYQPTTRIHLSTPYSTRLIYLALNLVSVLSIDFNSIVQRVNSKLSMYSSFIGSDMIQNEVWYFSPISSWRRGVQVRSGQVMSGQPVAKQPEMGRGQPKVTLGNRHLACQKRINWKFSSPKGV